MGLWTLSVFDWKVKRGEEGGGGGGKREREREREREGERERERIADRRPHL